MRIISIMANISYIGRENYFLNILLDFLKQKVSLLVMNQSVAVRQVPRV